MSPLGRVGRRPDHWSSAHDRARSDAAERIDGPLEPLEAAWLDEHLEGCADCRAVAAAYTEDQLALRSLRDVRPEPPRDLWARTAAGIEREASGRRARPSGQRAKSGPRIPLGAVSGAAVIAVVVGVSLISGQSFPLPAPAPTDGGASVAALPSDAGPSLPPAVTPIPVDVGSVAWMQTNANGDLAYSLAHINEVCPVHEQPTCAALDDSAAHVLTIKNTAKSVIGSPDDKQAVVVSSDGSVIVLVLPTEAPAPTPAESASSTATTNPSATPDASETPSVDPSETPSGDPNATPPASDSVEPSEAPASEDSSASVDASPSESLDPSPSVALELAIASGVTVVGDSAAFSADGQWFAFTARPADGSAGPDIYVWHVGDPTSVPLTSDGASVFASWDGDKVIGSRPADPLADGESASLSARIDPATAAQDPATFGVWRPVVSPTGEHAVTWDGTVVTDEDTHAPKPATGALVLTSWSADGPGSDRTPIDLGDASLANVDVRWDETGQWLAVWTGEADDATIGRLSLYRLDPDTGTLDQPDGAPADVPSLPGFSIGEGRLAWVTPDGQDAEGSRVQVVAWSGDDVGAVESVPGEDVIVVR